jgi:hypothetical protein
MEVTEHLASEEENSSGPTFVIFEKQRESQDLVKSTEWKSIGQ